MLRCKIINFLICIFPVRAWQDFWIRHHVQNCQKCQKKLASLKEVKALLIQESEGGNLEGEWLAIRERLKEGKREEKHMFRPRWHWIAGAACFLAAAAIGIWLYFSNTSDRSPQEKSLAERFRINYIRIENKPAKAFLFHPHDSKMIIIWAEKNS